MAHAHTRALNIAEQVLNEARVRLQEYCPLDHERGPVAPGLGPCVICTTKENVDAALDEIVDALATEDE